MTESVHVSFVKYLRDIGYDASSDSMVYQAFDIAYDYDIFDFMIEYLDGKITLERWMYEFYRQEGTYPKNTLNFAHLKIMTKSVLHQESMILRNSYN